MGDVFSHPDSLLSKYMMLLQYALGRKTKETLASFYKLVSLLLKNYI